MEGWSASEMLYKGKRRPPFTGYNTCLRSMRLEIPNHLGLMKLNDVNCLKTVSALSSSYILLFLLEMERYRWTFLIMRASKNMKEIDFCAGSGWDWVNFLHGSPYGAMVWICGQMLLTHQFFGYCWAASQHQGCFCFSHCPQPYNKTHWGCLFFLFLCFLSYWTEEWQLADWGGDIGRTADPNWPKVYPIWYHTLQ